MVPFDGSHAAECRTPHILVKTKGVNQGRKILCQEEALAVNGWEWNTGKRARPRSRAPERTAHQGYPSIGRCPPFVPPSPHRSLLPGDLPSKPFRFRLLQRG